MPEYLNLSIVGAIGDDGQIEASEIEALLELQPVKMVHNGPFNGKPETRIYADDRLVAKLNINRSFNGEQLAERWCRLQLERERQYQVYHPGRHWFYVRLNDGWLCANVMPRLEPLHLADFSSLDNEGRVAALEQLVQLYFGFLSDFGKRLDVGLSNYAFDGEKLYYLDDDIYLWDNCSSFVAMLANWLRQSGRLGLGEAGWRLLGERMLPVFTGYSSETIDMVCEMLEGQIVGKFEGYKKLFLEALRPRAAQQKSRLTKLAGMVSELEPIGLISDVHANLPAFETVLDHFKRRGIKRILMLGDMVGYGPHPAECIALAREEGINCIRGNHDHYVAHDGNVRVAASSTARWTLAWTATRISEEDKQWLADLPVRLVSQSWLAVHGSPTDKSFFNAYVYNMTAEKNLEYMCSQNIGLCLHGHSHIQGVYAMEGRRMLPMMTDASIELGPLRAALVCPGSVGQPRNGWHGAEGAILYPGDMRLELFSLDYDIRKVAADMEQAGFPQQMLERILAGK